MNTTLELVLRHVAITGGSPADSRYLRDQLGGGSLAVRKELRMIALGCADPTLVERVRGAFDQPVA